MNLEILLRGLIVGLLASVTLGPVGVMCIQRTLSKSRLSGLSSGLGAATADSLFATLAWFFIAVISGAIESNMQILKVVGGACVTAVGVHYFLKNPVVQIRRNRAGKANLVQDFVSTFALTLANPAYVLWLLVIFSAVGVGTGDAGADAAAGTISGAVGGSGAAAGGAAGAGMAAGMGEAALSKVGMGSQMILGFFSGAVAWWFCLTSVVSLFRRRFRPRHLLWINRIAGVLITALGLIVIVSAFI